ncbi:MAG TPA: hypothetical protein VN719_01585, partial [Gemmatimonadales bacterium]|nr:hypothetical protein [Gemmatimonadales bacterium]
MTAGSRWVLVATFVGAAIGYLFPDGAHATVFHASSLQVLSSLFLRLIKCLIAGFRSGRSWRKGPGFSSRPMPTVAWWAPLSWRSRAGPTPPHRAEVQKVLVAPGL